MKFKKEIIAIMLIICMLFTISAISAADSSEDAIGVANDTVKATTQDYSMQSNNDVEILNDGNNNALYDLQQTINSATDGSTVVLDRDYEYDMMYDYDTKDDGVTIDKNLTIDGQNHKIDAKGESAIFLVYSGLHVTFKDIVFMNGNASYGGGAIYSGSQVVGNVINCTFINNTNLGTNYGGGAINVRSNNWNIINSTFINNTDSSNYGGGAIYAISGIFNIVNSEFINSSGQFGGAIFTYNSRTQIYSSTFEKNNAVYGGAVYAWSAVTQFVNSTFEKNHAYQGGAGYLYQSNGYIDNSTFEKNDASEGTAIYAYDGTVNSNDSKFINNYAEYNGGAIYTSGSALLNCIDSNFTNNSANSGGAIYASGKNSKIINSIFLNNTALSAYGGGAAIYSASGTMDVIKSKFINNSANYYGGAVYAYESNMTSANSKFINNSANTGGAIHSHRANIQINNSTFVKNKASSSGGAISGLYSTNDDLGNITNSTFINNTAVSDGGAIYNGYNNIASSVDRCIFINNTATSQNSLGSAIFGASEIKNSIFLNQDDKCIHKKSGTEFVLLNNWFGSTVDNFDESPITISNNPIDNWYYLDVKSKDNKLVWSLKLYDRETGESSVVGNYNLPNITFSFSQENLTIDSNEMQLNKTGQYGLGYTLESENASITVQYETFKYTQFVSRGDFNILQELINNAQENGEIKLTRNYTYTVNIDSIIDGIVIDKPGLTIDGNGFAIDAKGQSRIFNVTENAHDLTIKNVIFINGHADEGAAIYCEGDNLNVENSIFINNKMNQIYADDSATIKNNWFGNTRDNFNVVYGVDSSVPVLSWYYLDVDDQTDGHAIVTLKLYNPTTKESSINDNYNLPDIAFKLSKDGIDFEESEIKLNQSGQYDVEYTSDSDKGSITAEYETSKFTKVLGETDFERLQRYVNEANVYDVIDLYENFTYQVGVDTITDGIQIKKTLTINGNGYTIDAKGQSRIFYMDFCKGLILRNVTLINANYSGNGGAIFSYSSINIVNCTFINGSANTGGLIYLQVKSNVTNCTFINGSAKSSGGVIYTAYDGSVISNCTFINSSALSGGSLYFYNKANVTNCTFINSTTGTGDTSEGGAIYVYYYATDSDIFNSTFINCSSKYGGSVYLYAKTNVTNCTFIKSTSPNDAGAIYVQYYAPDVVISNCTFVNSTAGNGAAIQLNGENTRITNCTFVNGTAGDGAAIHLNRNGIIMFNCTFRNGHANWGGGAIRSGDYVTLYSVINCTFINNTAPDHEGGAIMSYSSNMYICNSTFINNTASLAGAIWNSKNNLTIINSTFNHNVATTDYWQNDFGGGAIFYSGEGLTVINSTFANNSAIKYGGAILRNGDNSFIDNCTFINNTAERGAAIRSLKNNFTVIDSRFINNTATTQGGAIEAYEGDGLRINDTTFIGNSGNYGGVLYVNALNSLIYNCTFIKNSLTGSYHAILNYKSNFTVDKCLFINNNANYYWSRLISSSQADTVVSNSIFLNNNRDMFEGSFTIINNWFGNTIKNYDSRPSNIYSSVTPANWLFVNATFDRQMNVTDIYPGEFVFQSYANGEISDYDSSKVHEVNMTLSSEKGDIDKTTAVMGDEINYTPNQLGTGKITASFFRNLGVTDKSVDIIFDIGKKPIKIILDETSITIPAHQNITNETSKIVSVNHDVEGTFSYTTDDSTIINVTDPQFISGLKAGTAHLNITFTPANLELYEPSDCVIDITVTRDNSGITAADSISFDYGDSPIDIELALTPEYLNNLYQDGSVNLIFTSTNSSVFTVDANGRITPVNAGKANLTIKFEQTDDYNASEKNVTVTVNKVDSTLVLGNDIVFDYLSSNTTTITELGGASVDEANIKVIGHDEADIELNDNVITVSNLAVGTYTLNVTTTPDANHKAVSKTVSITVKRIAPTITIENGETDSVDVKSSITIIATVDSGADLTYTPNETGIVILEGNVATGLKAGKVNITVSAPQTDNYLAGSKNIIITVNRIDADIDASDFNVDVNADEQILVNKPTDYDGEITFESKTPALATVDDNGKVTGVAGGTATITINWTQTDLYKADSYDVTVTVDRIEAVITAEPLTVNVSETKGLKVNTPDDFDGTIVYTPQNPSNVTVDSEGNVTGLRGGDVVVTLTWAESPKYRANSTTVTVTVNKIEPTITIEKGETATVDAGSTLDIGATGSGTLTFKSNNTDVATVDENGVVTGVISGKVNITVYSAENDQYLPGSKNITVTVNKIEAKINASDIDVNVRDTNSLDLQKPDDYPRNEITFESDNNDIAYVGQDGVVSGVIGGDVIITISWKETDKYIAGSYKVNVHVEKLPANLHAQDLEVEYDHTKPLVVTHDSNGALSYEIADESIATFENGNVNGLKIGETTLTISISETDEYHSDTIEVPVNVVKTSPNLQAEAVLLHVGNTEPTVVTHLGDGALSYEITDTSIATVGADGKVTGVSDGTTTLKISIGESENYTSQDIEVNVVVTNKQIGNIIISDSQEYSVNVDGTILINATTNSDGTLSYSVNDSSVAILSDNELTGIKGGEVEVTITLPETLEYSGLTVTKKIKVNKLTPEITIDNGDSDVVDVDGNLIISAHTTSETGDITYASNDSSVATVDSLGNVTGVIGGKVNITVKSVETDKYEESTKNIIVTVNKLTPTITINNGNPVSVDVHSTVNINATKGDSDGILKYVSGNESRAVIDDRGNIKGVAGYPVVITVSVTETQRYAGKSVDVPVHVNKIDPVITITNVEPVSIYADESFVIDASANGAVLTYGSCNESIAAVDSEGKVTGLIGGVVNITVYAAETDEYEAGSKNLTVTVNKLTPEITIDDGDRDVNVDGNLIISAHTNSGGDITYSSNDTAVATVDSLGNVTGVTGGVVNITVKSVENAKYLELTKNITVTVNKLKPTITVNDGNDVSVDVHSTVNINATTDSDGVLEYVSADEAIASIDSEGNVTGVTGYSVNITVSVPETERYLANSVKVNVQVNKIDPVITINNVDPSVDADDSFVIDASANGAVLTYGSCNESIAAVDSEGKVTGLVGGVVNITVYAAETDEYKAGSKNLTVKVNKIEAVITPESLVLDVFETKHLNVDIPDDFKGTIVYASQNPDNVTVDENGNVTGKKGGDAVISLSWNETDKYLAGSTTATVTVNKIKPTITIRNGESASVGVKNNLTIVASANGAVLSYESNDTSIAVVDSEGKVNGKKAGIANITVYAEETDEYLAGSKNITVTVNKKPSTLIVYSVPSVDVFSTITLEVMTESTGRKLVFESSDSSIATVDAYGRVKGIVSGKVTITVTSLENDEYLEKSATVTIQVNKVKPTIGLDVANITVGETENAYITIPDPGRLYISVSKGSQVIYSAIENLNNNYYKYSNADLGVGNYTIMAKYYGSSRYTDDTITKDFIVRPIYKYDFDAEAEDTVFGNEGKVIVTLPEDAKGIIKIGDDEYEITGEKTVITLPAQTKSGKNNITVKYVAGEDSKYDSSEITASYYVSKKESDVNMTVPAIEIGENDKNITVELPEDATGTISLLVDGKVVDSKDVTGGKLNLTLGELAAGDHTVEVIYSGDDNYAAASNSTDVHIVKSTTEISANPAVIKEGETANITVSVDSDATGMVLVEVAGNKYFADLESGSATVKVAGLKAGNYTANVKYYGDEKYAESSTEVSVNVTEDKTIEELEKELEKSKANASSLKDQLDDANDRVADLTDKLNDANDRVADLEKQLQDSKNNASDLAEQLEIAKNNASDLTEQLEVAKNNASDLKDKLDVAEANASDLAEQLEVAKDNASDLKDKLDVAEANASDLAKQLEVAKNNASSLANQLKDANALVDSLTDQLKDAKDNASDLAKQLEVAKNNASALADQLKDANALVDSLTDELKDANALVNTLTDQLKDANALVDNLTGQLNDAKANASDLANKLDAAEANASSLADQLKDANALVDNLTGQLNDAKANASSLADQLKDANDKVADLTDKLDDANKEIDDLTAKLDAQTSIEVTEVSGATIKGTLTDSKGKGIAGATIDYTVNGKKSSVVTGNDGSFAIEGQPGAKITMAYAGDNKTAAVETSITIDDVVARTGTTILGNNFTQYAIEYYKGERGQNFTVQLKDVNGNPLANKTVYIGYNGKMLERTTDANGYARVQINLKDANRLTFAVSFLGDDEYEASMSVYLITIVKKPVTISAAAKTYKASATKKYTVKLSTIKGASADGKTYFSAGKKVTLKIDGKTYTAKTNDNGQATFTIKTTKKGKYAATISYAGDTTFESATKTVKYITIK